MKKFLFAFLGATFLMLSVLGNPIPIQGTWSNKGPRSPVQVPEPPTAFVEAGELVICFTDALSDLIVTVADVNGTVVYYQDFVSGNGGDTVVMPLASGNYLLTLEHRDDGFLRGEFKVE